MGFQPGSECFGSRAFSFPVSGGIVSAGGFRGGGARGCSSARGGDRSRGCPGGAIARDEPEKAPGGCGLRSLEENARRRSGARRRGGRRRPVRAGKVRLPRECRTMPGPGPRGFNRRIGRRRPVRRRTPGQRRGLFPWGRGARGGVPPLGGDSLRACPGGSVARDVPEKAHGGCGCGAWKKMYGGGGEPGEGAGDEGLSVREK